jgi:hypothetical protein
LINVGKDFDFFSVAAPIGEIMCFDGLVLTLEIEERRQSRELAPNCGRRQTASFHVLAPGNDMRSTHGKQTRIILQSGKRDKLPYIFLIKRGAFSGS